MTRKKRQGDPEYDTGNHLPSLDTIARASGEMRGQTALAVLRGEITRLDRLQTQTLQWRSTQHVAVVADYLHQMAKESVRATDRLIMYIDHLATGILTPQQIQSHRQGPHRREIPSDVRINQPSGQGTYYQTLEKEPQPQGATPKPIAGQRTGLSGVLKKEARALPRNSKEARSRHNPARSEGVRRMVISHRRQNPDRFGPDRQCAGCPERYSVSGLNHCRPLWKKLSITCNEIWINGHHTCFLDVGHVEDNYKPPRQYPGTPRRGWK